MHGRVNNGSGWPIVSSGDRRDVAVDRIRPRAGQDPFGDAVLDLTDLIPAGRVLTYGDVAELLERGGPRQVGRALSLGTRRVPWWRVLRADGRPAEGLAARAKVHYGAEGTPVLTQRRAGDPAVYRIDLARARWLPSAGEHEQIMVLGESLRM